ncbi:MAG: hypothetical protein WEB58_18635 [Planctomycetaceae bacterium]
MKSLYPRLGILAMTIMLATVGTSAPSADESDHNEDMPSQRQLLAAALDAYNAFIKDLRVGHSDDPEHGYQWSRRILEIEQKIANNQDGRITAAQDHLMRMQTLAVIIRAGVKTGKLHQEASASVEFYLLEAKTFLARRTE